MPVELRKRKAVEPAPAPAPKKEKATKKKGPVAKAIEKVKKTVAPEPEEPEAEEPKPAEPKVAKTNGATKVAVGATIDLEGFGGEIETNDGVKTTLKKLVDESKFGVVLFTYPKASTPGCTTQVCLFRDSYEPLTATGFSIYGLSKDSTKANTTFKTKQNLPYPLLCDVKGDLISAIGLKKAPSGTTRGVFVIDKSGKVLAAEPGGPAATVEVVKKLVAESPAAEAKPEEVAAPEPEKVEENGAKEKEDQEKAETAAEVADTAEKVDGAEEVKPAA
ncbi:AhpC-TSA-domain-containing protein [Coleophoma cylindrospora]|uniref:thioredoxin-dependent peroxiredoxin n=1 Tax=Coleophoma cylindrospora TaxID=1849047 RepID=A0A3D8QGA6_9HELO|nr:AhpC-TSA-domain-containing protein [Coleophoma cylindrospora]